MGASLAQGVTMGQEKVLNPVNESIYKKASMPTAQK